MNCYINPIFNLYNFILNNNDPVNKIIYTKSKSRYNIKVILKSEANLEAWI
jgi:hypothetical protein